MSNTNKRSWTEKQLRELVEDKKFTNWLNNRDIYNPKGVRIDVGFFLAYVESLSQDTKEECVCPCHLTKTGRYYPDGSRCCECKSSPTEVPVVKDIDVPMREQECEHEAWEEDGNSRRCADCRKYLGNTPVQSTQTTLPEEIKEITQHDFNARSEEALHSLNSVIRIVNTLSKRGKS